LGLGNLRSESVLGERLVAEIEVLSAGKERLDAACFRLHQPAGDGDVPWLRRAALNLRPGASFPILEVRSEQPVNDPVIQLGVAVACGFETQRDYTLFLSPRQSTRPQPGAPSRAGFAAPSEPISSALAAPHRSERRAERASPVVVPPTKPARPERLLPRMLPEAERLVLTTGIGAGEPMLRLAGELLSWSGENGTASKEAQREILRLEFRTLQVLNEQATSQLATAEKLRAMEATLGELHQRAGQFAERIEHTAAPTAATTESPPVEAAPPVAQPSVAPREAAPRAPAVVKEDAPWFSDMAFYGFLGGAVLGVAGWFGWRTYKQRRGAKDDDFSGLPAELKIDPQRQDEPDFDTLDFPVEPVGAGEGTQVDVHLDIDEPMAPQELSESPAVPLPRAGEPLSQFSVSNATVDEHFEVNPVMELADIMLSFGRVKGAAQALQEYIDHNPQEALQPWIRLLDVYRMAGMQAEFEQVSQNLTRNFNVEQQSWVPGEKPAVVSAPDAPLDITLEEMPPLEFEPRSPAMGPKAESLEDIPHIRDRLIELWGSDQCVAYLNQLLRDNRGGKRSGFPLSVVQEILFLIDVQETIFITAKEAELAQKEGESHE